RAQAAFVPQELTTVRVQDPRVQNEGFTPSPPPQLDALETLVSSQPLRGAVAWWLLPLKCCLLLCPCRPVPELPGKSTFFVGSTDEFVEKRRQGLQQFLEKVVQNVVLLSDSRLHLFLQSQLSVPELEA
ncbi:SNX11 protein, partial [Chloroceryle aenea]|nr:SNX11 protein [Chloroceryle aenea]